ncbi:MAG TPA: DUF1192 domain-containing protein [Rhodospirillales bacterium]|nr:DUF1192 domain-containing protein [Rhodospirillales bacterium]
MDTDDLEPPRKKTEQKDLEVMSIEALGEYIEKLEEEIERARAAIKLKETARSGAQGAFKT